MKSPEETQHGQELGTTPQNQLRLAGTCVLNSLEQPAQPPSSADQERGPLAAAPGQSPRRQLLSCRIARSAAASRSREPVVPVPPEALSLRRAEGACLAPYHGEEELMLRAHFNYL